MKDLHILQGQLKAATEINDRAKAQVNFTEGAYLEAQRHAAECAAVLAEVKAASSTFTD